MAISVSLETNNIQHSLVGNNTVSFEMNPDSQGDLTLSLENNGTSVLQDVTVYVDQISDGLSLGNVGHLPIRIYEGSMAGRDSFGLGWTLLSPREVEATRLTFVSLLIR